MSSRSAAKKLPAKGPKAPKAAAHKPAPKLVKVVKVVKAAPPKKPVAAAKPAAEKKPSATISRPAADKKTSPLIAHPAMPERKQAPMMGKPVASVARPAPAAVARPAIGGSARPAVTAARPAVTAARPAVTAPRPGPGAPLGSKTGAPAGKAPSPSPMRPPLSAQAPKGAPPAPPLRKPPALGTSAPLRAEQPKQSLARSFYWSELRIGDDLPPLSKPVIDRVQIARYTSASNDFNRLHLDEPFAHAVGFPGIFGPGMLAMGFVGQLLTSWLRRGHVRRLSARFVKLLWPGDELTCRGRIGDLRKDAAACYADVELWAENQKGELVLRGQATCELYESPSAAGGDGAGFLFGAAPSGRLPPAPRQPSAEAKPAPAKAAPPAAPPKKK